MSKKPSEVILVSTNGAVVSLTKPVDLEKLPPGQIGNCFRFDADSLGHRAIEMIDQIATLKQERAMKGVLAGIYLAQTHA